MPVSIKRYSKDTPRAEIDADALADLRTHLRPLQHEALIELAELVANKHEPFQVMPFAFDVIGVKGTPFHAFCRKHCPVQYKKWMEAGPNGVPLGPDLWPIADEAAWGEAEADAKAEAEAIDKAVNSI